MAATGNQTCTVFSLDEVAKHNQPDDAWIVIRGEVFDVSTYFDEHPGGRNVLIEVAGSDATEDFEYLDHSDYAIRIMRKFQVGVLTGDDKAAGHMQKQSVAKPRSWKLVVGVLSISSLAMVIVQFDTVRRLIVRGEHITSTNSTGFWAGGAIASSATVLGLFFASQRLKRAAFSHNKGVFEYAPYYVHPLT